DDVGAFMVRSNRFVDVTFGIYYLFHADSPYSSVTGLGNEFVLDRRQGWGFLACDICDPGQSGTITNVTMLNNLIRYPDWSSPPGGGGLLASDIHPAVFGNNILVMDSDKAMRVRPCPSVFIPPPPPTEDCDHPLFIPPQNSSYPPCLD